MLSAASALCRTLKCEMVAMSSWNIKCLYVAGFLGIAFTVAAVPPTTTAEVLVATTQNVDAAVPDPTAVREAAIKRFRQSDKGKLLMRAVEDAEKKNERARTSDDAQAKLDGANGLLNAKAAFATAQLNALASDPVLQAVLAGNRAIKAPATADVPKNVAG
jgi:hypothetical protein